MSPLVAARSVLLMPKPYHPLDSRPVVFLDATNSAATLAAGMAAEFVAAQLERLVHAGNALLRGDAGGWHRFGWARFAATGAQETILSTLSGNDGMLIEKTAADVLQLTGGSGAATAAAAHGTALSATTWYFWYTQYDGVNLGISLNAGALTTQALASFSPGANAFNLGADLTPANFFGGRKQCFGGGDGVLTSAQITALYNSGTPPSYAQTLSAGITPGFFFPLDEPSGARVDLVGALSLTDTNTVTTAAGTCLQAVSAKGDLSGGSHNAVQATQANQSRWRTAYVNGQPAWVYDGTNDFDTIDDFAQMGDGTQLTVLVVARVNSANAGNLIGQWDGIVAQDAWIVTSIVTTGVLRVVLSDNGTMGAGHFKDYRSPASIVGAWHVIGFRFAGGTSLLELLVDSATPVTPTKAADGAITGLHDSTVAITVAAALGGGVAGDFCPCAVSLAIIFPRALPNGELAKCIRWAGRRFGIATT